MRAASSASLAPESDTPPNRFNPSSVSALSYMLLAASRLEPGTRWVVPLRHAPGAWFTLGSILVCDMQVTVRAAGSTAMEFPTNLLRVIFRLGRVAAH